MKTKELSQKENQEASKHKNEKTASNPLLCLYLLGTKPPWIIRFIYRL